MKKEKIIIIILAICLIGAASFIIYDQFFKEEPNNTNENNDLPNNDTEEKLSVENEIVKYGIYLMSDNEHIFFKDSPIKESDLNNETKLAMTLHAYNFYNDVVQCSADDTPVAKSALENLVFTDNSHLENISSESDFASNYRYSFKNETFYIQYGLCDIMPSAPIYIIKPVSATMKNNDLTIEVKFVYGKWQDFKLIDDSWESYYNTYSSVEEDAILIQENVFYNEINPDLYASYIIEYAVNGQNLLFKSISPKN